VLVTVSATQFSGVRPPTGKDLGEIVTTRFVVIYRAVKLDEQRFRAVLEVGSVALVAHHAAPVYSVTRGRRD
jgi:hypothetical protein